MSMSKRMETQFISSRSQTQPRQDLLSQSHKQTDHKLLGLRQACHQILEVFCKASWVDHKELQEQMGKHV